MDDRQRTLFMKMVQYDPDPLRIHHLTKVRAFAEFIAEGENLADDLREILGTAAIVHDIAIKTCLEKYGSDAGSLQEREGPPIARAMLEELGYPTAEIDRVCWLVAHHHTYHIETIDHQILVEADFLVNAHESCHSDEAKQNTLKNIFKTPTGSRLFKAMYAL